MTADKPSHLVPRLRFPEFREGKGWARVPLNSVLSEDKIKSDGQTEVHSVSLTKGVVSQVEHMGRSFSAADTSHYSLVRPFDVVYTKSPLAIFKLGIVKQHRGPHNALVSPLYGAFTPANRHIGQLIEAYFDSPSRSLRFLDPLAQKGAKNTIQISNEKFLSGELFLPSDEREQQKIADCLGSLDDLIAAEGRKLEALHRHKQGLMQQLFPQPGEIVPRLRFPEFEDAGPWEQLTIDEAADFKNGYAFKSDTYVESGDFQIVTIGNVQAGRLDLESTKSIETLPRDIQNHQILKPADILVSMTGNVGRVCLVPVDGLLLNQRVGKLIPRRIDHDFFFQMLHRNEFRSAMQLAAAGGAQGNVSAGEIKSFVFARPVDPKEQRGIADCLSTLDTQIAAQVRKLDALRQHKQGLLQHLFPSLEGQ